MNIWTKFQQLNQSEPIIIARVMETLVDEGASVVKCAGGGEMRVWGADWSVGGAVFVQAGRILAAAPDLPHYELSI